nr:SMP-30/gluconolactonase/LRE family protein [Neobacillus niacini]
MFISLNSLQIELSLYLQKRRRTRVKHRFVFGQFEGGIGPDGLAVDTEGNLYVAHFQAGEVVVLDANGFKYGTIRLPEDAGTFTTNLTFHNGYLYVTESLKNEVWRIKVKKKGLQPYGLQ